MGFGTREKFAPLMVLLGALALLCIFPGLAQAGKFYGTVVVEQGVLTLVRDGQARDYKASSTEVTVEEKDLLRVREASRVVLKTREHATLNLGSNAILHCEPWIAPKSHGTIRLLFGRFRAKIEGLAGSEGFNVRTTTATIGVKGTEYSLAQASNGNTAVLALENTVTATGADGVEQPVPPGQVSAIVGDAGATKSAPAPEAFQREMAKIDAPPPDSKAALDLPAEKVLVEQGIVSQEALDRSKVERPRLELDTHGIPIPKAPMNLEDTDTGGSGGRFAPGSR